MSTPSNHSASYYSDGLTPHVLDALLAGIDKEIVDAPRPTSSVLDGSAAERRRRRIERRAISAVVRSLPARPSVAYPEGEVA